MAGGQVRFDNEGHVVETKPGDGSECFHTLQEHLLRNREGRRFAVLVNDMSEINIDAALVAKGDAALRRSDEKLVELSNGCICCTLRDDLLREVRALAMEGRFDHLVIESTGVSEPAPVAHTFSFVHEDGTSLADVAAIDAMVTVVDASTFRDRVRDEVALDELGLGANEDDDRPLAGLLVEQVEFADVIVMNKTDLVDEAELRRCEATIRALNARARIVKTRRGQVPIESLVGIGAYDQALVERSPLWIRELTGAHTPETETYGITSFVLRDPRPFDPDKLWALLQSGLGSVLRGKGFFWVASQPGACLQWSRAGRGNEIGRGGTWWAAAPRSAWPTEPELLAQIEARWHPYFGDRCQELVFIGLSAELDRPALEAQLRACLLDDWRFGDGWDGEDPFAALLDPAAEHEERA